MQLNWSVKSYQELSTDELYQVLKLRQDVFMLEQNSLYQDLDNQDQQATHIMVWQQNTLVGYARLLAEQDASNSSNTNSRVKYGRFVLAKSARGVDLGKQLAKFSIELAFNNPQVNVIQISAQQALTQYYQSFGFYLMDNEPYDDGGVMHVDMALEREGYNQTS